MGFGMPLSPSLTAMRVFLRRGRAAKSPGGGQDRRAHFPQRAKPAGRAVGDGREIRLGSHRGLAQGRGGGGPRVRGRGTSGLGRNQGRRHRLDGSPGRRGRAESPGKVGVKRGPRRPFRRRRPRRRRRAGAKPATGRPPMDRSGVWAGKGRGRRLPAGRAPGKAGDKATTIEPTPKNGGGRTCLYYSGLGKTSQRRSAQARRAKGPSQPGANPKRPKDSTSSARALGVWAPISANMAGGLA